MESFQRRRERVADGLQDDQVLVVATHAETPYSNDVEPRFRPHSDFWYLTGFAEPGAVLTIGADGATDLWLRPRQPEQEVWTGRRLGLERIAELGLDKAHDISDTAALRRRLNGHAVIARTEHHEIHEVVARSGEVEDAAAMLAQMRMVKDADEVAMLREACRIGADAMADAMRMCRPGTRESAIEGALLHHYRAQGSTGAGYPPIVGRGPNAAILHYIENQDTVQAGDLVLIDAGCEWGYYNSDITRTMPADGAFTKTQLRLYETVHAAQQAGIQAAQAGAPITAPHRAAVEVLIDGLVDIGYLSGDKDKLLEEQAHRPFYMHGTSHFLGLDVHDAGAYKGPDGEPTKLRPGMCITVEPGLYFNRDYATCPPQAVDIGIRLENDIIIQDDGPDDLVAALPASPDDVLAWMSA